MSNASKENKTLNIGHQHNQQYLYNYVYAIAHEKGKNILFIPPTPRLKYLFR